MPDQPDFTARFMEIAREWVVDKPDYDYLKVDVIDWLMKNQEIWFNQADPDRIERALNQAYTYAQQIEKRRAYLAMPSTSTEEAEACPGELTHDDLDAWVYT